MTRDLPSVLIVDDSEGVCMAAAMMLEEDNYTVETCHSYQDGIQLARDGNFRIILIDVLLGMESGIELAQELVDAEIKSKLVFISGLADIKEELSSHPALQHISVLLKPFGRHDLLACTRKLLNEAAA